MKCDLSDKDKRVSVVKAGTLFLCKNLQISKRQCIIYIREEREIEDGCSNRKTGSRRDFLQSNIQ